MSHILNRKMCTCSMTATAVTLYNDVVFVNITKCIN